MGLGDFGAGLDDTLDGVSNRGRDGRDDEGRLVGLVGTCGSHAILVLVDCEWLRSACVARGRSHLAGSMATFSAHTALPPPRSRTPAGSRASSRYASIAPRTTSAHGPPPWDARRTRTHRSIPAPPTPAGASRLLRTVPCPTRARSEERRVGHDGRR